jgi:3-phenylpropionate/trans-cinnamate dioxygenase ferredoxin reductase component
MSHRMPRHIVVVGNGIAGVTASDALRSAGFDGELTVIGEERHAPYSRPALSKAALLDQAEVTSHLLPAPSHGATEILGVGAIDLDVERRVVSLSDGSDIGYDALVIASGARAQRLGRSAPDERSAQMTLRGLDDAVELRRRVAGAPPVVVIGGGALGMEVASGCAALGCEVTLVARTPPMSSQLGPHLSDVLVAAACAAGVTVRLSSSVSVIDDGESGRVVLDDGMVIDAEIVLSAVGDHPNTEWLASSGLLVGGELRVDTRGRIRPDIVAAGDVAAFPTTRGVRRVALWTSAIEQARIAAPALLRADEAPELAFEPYFWTEQFGLSLKACGHLPVAGEPHVVDGASSSGRALMTWSHNDGPGAAVALNYRIPVPKLRTLSRGSNSATAA